MTEHNESGTASSIEGSPDLIGDTGIVRAVRGAVDKEREMRNVPGLSLLGDEGSAHITTLQLLASGRITLEQAGSGFYKTDGGALGIELDAASVQALADMGPWPSAP